jgi:ABC-2 type transport system permease protein
MEHLGFAGVLLRLSLLNELQYRVNFFVYLFQSLLSLGTGLVVVALVFDNVSELNGWSRSELLVVLGVYTLLGGVITAVIEPNMKRMMADVQDGTFDFVLTKPVDTQLFVSLRQVQIWKVVDVIAGAAVAAVGIVQLDERLSVARVVAFVAMLAFGVTLVYCLWLVVTTASFKLVRMDEIGKVFDGVFQAGRWPIGVYPNWLRVGLTFLVPVGFAVTVPAEALTGRLDWPTVVLAATFAFAVAIATRWHFRRALRHYSGASA